MIINKSKSEGYFFVALGEQYIDECYNLTLTLRKNGDSRPVSLLIKEEHLYYCKEKNIFDNFILYKPIKLNEKIWNECNTSFEKYCLMPRLFLNVLSPYDITITVDSDVLCQYDTKNLWDFCNKSEKSLIMIGYNDDLSWHWNKLNNVIDKYKKHVPCVHGGFFYYQKNNNFTNSFFNYAKEVFFKYDEYGCKRWFRDGKTDEILFAISHSKFNIKPIEFDEFPVMTFNYEPHVQIPSTLQTYGKNNTQMNFKEPIPFVHMFDKLHGKNYNELLNKILK